MPSVVEEAIANDAGAPMPDPVVPAAKLDWLDHQLRERALEYALKFEAIGESAADVVARAEAFLTFLRAAPSDADEATVQ